MNATDFRRIALGMKDAVEGAHMGHPDFRVGGRTFASIHHDRLGGMVFLTPDAQQTFVRERPDMFAPENGAWGRSGYTRVRFDAADEDTLGDAMTRAWQNTVSKGPAARPARRGAPKRSRASRKS